MSGTGDCRYARPMCGACARLKRRREFVGEQVRRGSTISAPPILDFADLRVRFGRGEDLQAHRGRRSSSRIRDSGRRPPASADLQDVNNASCKARRSSLVRSSPSSSATRSTTVPSGKVVGSSRTRRPLSTRARRGPIWLLYGIPRCSASRWQRRRRSARSAAAGFTHSNGIVVLQPGSRVRPFPVHRRGDVLDRPRAPRPHFISALDRTRPALRHRHDRNVLGHPTPHRLLNRLANEGQEKQNDTRTTLVATPTDMLELLR